MPGECSKSHGIAPDRHNNGHGISPSQSPSKGSVQLDKTSFQEYSDLSADDTPSILVTQDGNNEDCTNDQNSYVTTEVCEELDTPEVTDTINWPAKNNDTENSLTGKYTNFETEEESESTSERTKNNTLEDNGTGSAANGPPETWFHEEETDRDEVSGQQNDRGDTLYTFRRESEIVSINRPVDQTRNIGHADSSENLLQYEDCNEIKTSGTIDDQEEDDTFTGSGDEISQADDSLQERFNNTAELGDEQDHMGSLREESDSPSPNDISSPEKNRSKGETKDGSSNTTEAGRPPKTDSPYSDSLKLEEATASLQDMQGSLQDLFKRAKFILDQYHEQISSRPLKEFVLELDNFQSNFAALTNVYTECEQVTSAINTQLKNVRVTTEDIWSLINKKFREEDLSAWIDPEEGADIENNRLQEEREAAAKITLAKVSEAKAAVAKAAVAVTESQHLAAQTEAEAAEAKETAQKAREVAHDALKVAEEARRAAEEKRKIEEEAKRKALEKEKQRVEEERLRQEEEEKRLAEEARRKGTSLEDEREREADERARREAERKNPKNWPRYIYSMDPGDYDPGVGCIIRAIEGSLTREDVEVKRIDQLSGLLTLSDNEELISSIVEVSPGDSEKTFHFEEPMSIAFPHCAPRSGSVREPVIKILQQSGQWSEMVTNDVAFEDIKELRFVETRVRRFGTFVVVYRVKRDTLTLTKKGGKVTSSVDARVTLTSKPLGFKFNTNFSLEVQPVDLGTVADLRYRKPGECGSLMATSPIITLGLGNRKLLKPITISVPVPPNPSRSKRPATSIHREKPTKTDNRPSTAKSVMSSYTKKEEETHVEDLHLLYKDSDGTWVKVSDICLVQAKNKDIVTFDTSLSYPRFFILRTRVDTTVPQVEKMAALLEEAVSQRTIQIFLRQHVEDLNNVVLSCANISKVDRSLRKLSDDGYDDGPSPSKAIFVKEGQVMEMLFRGNLRPEVDVPKTQFVFNSHISCKIDFRITVVDTFAQKGFDSYRGFTQIFTKGLIAKPIQQTDDKSRSTTQKPPRFEMVEGDVLLCELLMSVPKTEPEPPKPLITVPVSMKSEGAVTNDVLLHIAREVGDEWKKLAQYLNVKRTRIQAIMRQNVNSDNTQKIYDMLMTWSKRLPTAMDKAEILCHALAACGRGDLAEELRERRDEFKRERSFSARDSHLRKAFVKVARDPRVVGEWKNLARHLGLADKEMLDIERVRMNSHDRCFFSLQKWREQKGEDATLVSLSQSLKQCKYRGLAREIQTIS